MDYLGIGVPELTEKNAIHTAREISQQPDLWQRVWSNVDLQRQELQKFLDTALSDSKRIILTGAGTSAFIGLSLTGTVRRKTGIPTEAIASTDLVSHPADYFHAEIPTLVISFARSGNSPESVAVVDLADQFCKTCYHLIITCNAQGKLAQYGENPHTYVLSLPPEANDKSLAMTSSYTGMLLAGLLVTDLDRLEKAKESVDVLTGYARKIIEYHSAGLRKLATKNFTRAVFLGSGPFFGTAKESHLKLQELTDGRVICKEDSFLGFRHGPKVIIDDSTLVFYIFSNVEYVSKYERDLVHSMKKGHAPMLEVGLMESVRYEMDLDYTISLSDNGPGLSEAYLAVCCAVPAQILAFYKSLDLGLTPDAPSATGAITRVVEGVKIYDLEI